MKNSVSDQSFYIESEDEEEEVEKFNRHEDDGHDIYTYFSSAENLQQSKPSSLATQWPQSYRQSIDLYSNVPSPTIGFLGTPTVSRLGSSFLLSSLTRRFTPEIQHTPVRKPLLPPSVDDEIQPDKRSTHSLVTPAPPSRKTSVRFDDKVYEVDHAHGIPLGRQSTYGQAVMNGINVLCGVGILSTPYAAKEGGWLGLIILLTFALLSYYTGLLLRQCLDSSPELETYPDIGQAAFGAAGRITLSIILYVELYASCVDYIILEGDNLSSLFPNAHLSWGGFELSSHRFFCLITTLAVLPTVWLRDLSVLSYISAGGVVASLLVVLCLFWVGLVDQVGFHNKGTPLNFATLPVAVGLYGFCYSGHAVFPNIYTSMAEQAQFSSVLLSCFGICTLLYAGTAIVGYKMFGEAAESQFTLNMPKDLIASKIAVWATIVNPFTKYALTLSPVAMSLEELLPSRFRKSHFYPIVIRTLLVISTLLVGLSVPFFGLVLSLIGSLLTMLVALILPPACYLSILRGKVSRIQAAVCIIIIAVGVVSSVIGTYSALTKIIENLRNVV
ncbi:amino acid transporter AVT1C-like [Hibiscus syriacus]|uniref:amino acid transporter AVT1C-like n=1 Tax=Hibiscus syriacus TaxID=106335 RepID=UPI001923E0F0|nr:amino acid transporter AVT1C-like [Hibiscus syriacus]